MNNRKLNRIISESIKKVLREGYVQETQYMYEQITPTIQSIIKEAQSYLNGDETAISQLYWWVQEFIQKYDETRKYIMSWGENQQYNPQ